MVDPCLLVSCSFFFFFLFDNSYFFCQFMYSTFCLAKNKFRCFWVLKFSEVDYENVFEWKDSILEETFTN